MSTPAPRTVSKRRIECHRVRSGHGADAASLDLFKVKALYFYPLTTDLLQCVLLEIEAKQRPRFPMQLQRGVKPFYAGHITGVGEQHRGIAVHRVVFHHPIGAAGR